MSDHDHSCSCQGNNNSGFIFGLIMGAIIAALVAIVIYKNDKSDVLENLQTKLTKFFKGTFGGYLPKKTAKSTQKKPVILPKKIIKLSSKIKPKTFLKPKK